MFFVDNFPSSRNALCGLTDRTVTLDVFLLATNSFLFTQGDDSQPFFSLRISCNRCKILGIPKWFPTTAPETTGAP